jgi:deazaflavin-dependent nitroreductase family protein
MPKRLADTHPERGLLRVAVRLPIWLYRVRLGWLLGNRFLLLTHAGRRSGLPRQTVLEVVRYDRTTDTYVVASGWGEKADWLQNVQQTPAVTVTVGCRRVEATAVRLSTAAALRELQDYAKSHPIAFRFIVRLVTGQPVKSPDAAVSVLARSVPLITLQRRPPPVPSPQQ